MCSDLSKFSEINRSSTSILNLANNSTTSIDGKGKIRLAVETKNGKKMISLKNASHVPDLRTNILSVSKITDRGLTVIFGKDEAEILNENGEIELHADRVGDLYFVRETEEQLCNAVCSLKVNKVSLDLLHRRLCHANVQDIRRNFVWGVELQNGEQKSTCEICLQGKMSRNSFSKKSNQETEILEIIHSDVCGPLRVPSLGGAKYYVQFIDDKSKWCKIRFLKSKSEVFEATKDYIKLVENQKGKTVKYLQTDNGGEFTRLDFDNYLKERGIKRRLTVPYNREQNGTSERKNRTLFDAARCLLLESNLPNIFWAEAVNTANYLKNRSPTRNSDGRTPFEAWTGKVPDLSHLKVFGCNVFYLNREPGRGKLDER